MVRTMTEFFAIVFPLTWKRKFFLSTSTVNPLEGKATYHQFFGRNDFYENIEKKNHESKHSGKSPLTCGRRFVVFVNLDPMLSEIECRTCYAERFLKCQYEVNHYQWNFRQLQVASNSECPTLWDLQQMAFLADELTASDLWSPFTPETFSHWSEAIMLCDIFHNSDDDIENTSGKNLLTETWKSNHQIAQILKELFVEAVAYLICGYFVESVDMQKVKRFNLFNDQSIYENFKEITKGLVPKASGWTGKEPLFASHRLCIYVLTGVDNAWIFYLPTESKKERSTPRGLTPRLLHRHGNSCPDLDVCLKRGHVDDKAADEKLAEFPVRLFRTPIIRNTGFTTCSLGDIVWFPKGRWIEVSFQDQSQLPFHFNIGDCALTINDSLLVDTGMKYVIEASAPTFCEVFEIPQNASSPSFARGMEMKRSAKLQDGGEHRNKKITWPVSLKGQSNLFTFYMKKPKNTIVWNKEGIAWKRPTGGYQNCRCSSEFFWNRFMKFNISPLLLLFFPSFFRHALLSFRFLVSWNEKNSSWKLKKLILRVDSGVMSSKKKEKASNFFLHRLCYTFVKLGGLDICRNVFLCSEVTKPSLSIVTEEHRSRENIRLRTFFDLHSNSSFTQQKVELRYALSEGVARNPNNFQRFSHRWIDFSTKENCDHLEKRSLEKGTLEKETRRNEYPSFFDFVHLPQPLRLSPLATFAETLIVPEISTRFEVPTEFHHAFSNAITPKTTSVERHRGEKDEKKSREISKEIIKESSKKICKKKRKKSDPVWVSHTWVEEEHQVLNLEKSQFWKEQEEERKSFLEQHPSKKNSKALLKSRLRKWTKKRIWKFQVRKDQHFTTLVQTILSLSKRNLFSPWPIQIEKIERFSEKAIICPEVAYCLQENLFSLRLPCEEFLQVREIMHFVSQSPMLKKNVAFCRDFSLCWVRARESVDIKLLEQVRGKEGINLLIPRPLHQATDLEIRLSQGPFGEKTPFGCWDFLHRICDVQFHARHGIQTKIFEPSKEFFNVGIPI